MDEDLEIEYERPEITGYQKAALFHDKRYGFIEGTTKSGKTHGGMLWLLEQAMMGTAPNYYWVAPVYGQAKVAYTRIKKATDETLRKCNDTELTITLPNGNVMWFKSAEKPDNLYGDNVGAALIDEASRMREEAWWAIRSTLTKTRGPVRVIGNVRGRRNWFFKLCRRAEAGESDMVYAKVTAHDAVKAGILPQEEIDDAKRILPIEVFNELYMAVPTEDGSNPFGMRFIAACASLDAPTGLPVVARGLDVARAVDWTVLIGLDSGDAVAYFDRFQKPWEEFYQAVEDVTDRDQTSTLVDSTGIGDVILSRLQRDRPRRFDGYKFSSESKQRLMEGLSVAIQHGEIKIPKDGPIRAELENFEFEYTRTGVRYSAPDGMHDDCVMALALAVAARTQHVRKQERRLYMNWGDRNEIAELTAYNQTSIDNGQFRLISTLVPSDRRAWTMTWFCVFPNGDVVAVAEQPDEALHEETLTPVKSIDEYRRSIMAVEQALGLRVEDRDRLADPDKIGEGPGSLRSLLAAKCQECTEKEIKQTPRVGLWGGPAEADRRDLVICKHRLSYRPAIMPEPPNYAVVRAAIGDPGGRPTLYALRDYTKNFCFAMANAQFREEKNPEKGLSEQVIKRDRGPADTALMIYNAKLNIWPKPPAPVRIIPRRKY